MVVAVEANPTKLAKFMHEGSLACNQIQLEFTQESIPEFIRQAYTFESEIVTPFHNLARSGCTDVIKFYLAKTPFEPTADQTKEGAKAMDKIDADMTDMIKTYDGYLYQHTLFTSTERHKTPLMYAAEYGKDATVTALLDAGADKDAKNLAYFEDSETAMILAAKNGYAGSVTLLLNAGADYTVKTAGDLFQTASQIATTNGYTEVVTAINDYIAAQIP